MIVVMMLLDAGRPRGSYWYLVIMIVCHQSGTRSVDVEPEMR